MSGHLSFVNRETSVSPPDRLASDPRLNAHQRFKKSVPEQFSHALGGYTITTSVSVEIYGRVFVPFLASDAHGALVFGWLSFEPTPS